MKELYDITTTYSNKIRCKIIQIRSLLDLDQSNFAKTTHVSKRTIQRIESGFMPDICTILRICDSLNISVDYLLDRNDTMMLPENKTPKDNNDKLQDIEYTVMTKMGLSVVIELLEKDNSFGNVLKHAVINEIKSHKINS